MKFLIAVPSYVLKRFHYYHIPLGLLYISSNLKKRGFDVEIVNLNEFPEDPLESTLRRFLLGMKIDVLCTGGLSPHYQAIKSILQVAKHVKSDIITVAGGGLISSEPELMMRLLPLDFGVIGEGDETIGELASALETGKGFDKVNGIIYKDPENGAIVQTLPRTPLSDIDSVPWPDYEGVNTEDYLTLQKPSDCYYRSIVDNPRELALIASRSCPYKCTFCYHPLGNKYRQRSLDSIFEEIEFLVLRYKINILAIYDELFSSDLNRLSEFCTRIKKYGIHWSAQLRVDKVNREILSLMKDSGCYIISYGIESAQDEILKSLKKYITVAQIENALRLTNDSKICVQGNIIIGAEDETIETANTSLRWALDNWTYQLGVNHIQVYPGSELYAIALKKGIITDKAAYIEARCPVINVTKMTSEEFSSVSASIKKMRFPKITSVAEIISLEKKTEDSFGRDSYYLKLRCQYCRQEVEYNNMAGPMPHGNSLFFCRKCFMRYEIPLYFSGLLNYESFKALNSAIDYILNRLKQDTKIALWGFNDVTYLVFVITRLCQKKIACIFDSRKEVQGQEMDGVKVIPLPDNAAEALSYADAIIITSNNNRTELQAREADLQKAGIMIADLHIKVGASDL
ncbi:MAG: B12-binding domain-containing radical SAM protein [Dissulfurispiraceae bacterium]